MNAPETSEQRRDRHTATADAFRLWLGANPGSTRGERYAAFDRIADSFAPQDTALLREAVQARGEKVT